MTVLGLLFALFVNQRLSAVEPGAHAVLRAQCRVGDRHRPGLGVAARHAVRAGQPLSRLSRHRRQCRGSPRRAGRWSASASPRSGGTSASPSCCSLPRCRTSRASSSTRRAVDGAGRWQRFRHRHPAASAAGDQHGGDAAAHRHAAHLQPGLRHDQWRAGGSSSSPIYYIYNLAIVQQPVRLRLGGRAAAVRTDRVQSPSCSACCCGSEA